MRFHEVVPERRGTARTIWPARLRAPRRPRHLAFDPALAGTVRQSGVPGCIAVICCSRIRQLPLTRPTTIL
jgi:hypothetical protein